MALFVKRNTEGDSLPLYSTSLGETVLIAGLGNIGKEYVGTRHNIGFEAVDYFAKLYDFPAWIEKKDLRCHLTKNRVGDKNVIIIKPTTFMNESGQSVLATQKYFRLPNSKTVVVHDDLDVDFGQIRCRRGGGSAGNNGIKSLITQLGEDFYRLRIGIKNSQLEKMDSADFVLAKFNKEERGSITKLTKEVSSIISEYTVQGKLINKSIKIF